MKIPALLVFLFVALVSYAQNAIDLYSNKAQVAIDEKNYADAIKYLGKMLDNKQGLRSKNELASVYVNRAICYYKLSKISDAENDFATAEAISPELIKIYDGRDEMYSSLMKWDLVIENALKGYSINKKKHSFLVRAASGYVEKKDFVKSKTLLDSVLKSNPGDLLALNVLSGYYNAQSKFTESLEVNNKIIDLYPGNPGAYLNRSICYAEMELYDKAQKDNEYAIKLDSTLKYVALNNNVFFILLKQQKYREAMEDLNKALLLKPDFAYALCNRGFCHLKLGNIKEALSDLNKSLELDNANTYALKNMALVKIEQKKNKEACMYLNKAKVLGYSLQYGSEVDDLISAHCR